MILLIDNYDSFTYNLASMFSALGAEVDVRRNDRVSVEEISKAFNEGEISGIVISPGPGTPDEAGISLDVVALAEKKRIPLFGVCLGHQCIAQHFGATIVRAETPVHGKTSEILHAGAGLLEHMPRPFIATRYHSLIVDEATVPESLEVTCRLRDDKIMGLSHIDLPIHGVQFHPESVLTPDGEILLNDFLRLAGEVEPSVEEVRRTTEGTSSKSIDSLKDALKIVIDGGSLSEDQATRSMELIMDGEATDAQMASLITMLRMKGETTDEIVGFARGMRSRATTVVTASSSTLDIVGTGGDGLKTFNISTTSAFVIAGAGVPVAKHGNRAVSSASGAADVLEALGVDINLTPAQMGRCINEIGIGFLFANILHSSMRNVAGPRREIAIRTVFNILGPLTNPAGARLQMLGVYSPELVPVMAEVAGRLGADHVLVAHGHPGMDEVSASGTTFIGEYKNGTIDTYDISPETYGIARGTTDALAGGTPEENAAITRAILSGEKGPRRDIVLMNAGLALYASNKASDIAEGIAMGRESIDSGAALAKLDALCSFTRRLAQER